MMYGRYENDSDAQDLLVSITGEVTPIVYSHAYVGEQPGRPTNARGEVLCALCQEPRSAHAEVAAADIGHVLRPDGKCIACEALVDKMTGAKKAPATLDEKLDKAFPEPDVAPTSFFRIEELEVLISALRLGISEAVEDDNLSYNEFAAFEREIIELQLKLHYVRQDMLEGKAGLVQAPF